VMILNSLLELLVLISQLIILKSVLNVVVVWIVVVRPGKWARLDQTLLFPLLRKICVFQSLNCSIGFLKLWFSFD
jgi:hypothetical protein